MKPAPFTYHSPTTLEETVAMLSQLAPQDGRIIAGGQSLVPAMAFRLAKPEHLIDINGVAALDKLKAEGGTLAIGALTRHATFHKADPAFGPLGALLAEVVKHIAHYPIRTRGTFCGSLAHADPASEWCLVAATLDATVIAKSARGERKIAAKDYFHGLMATALQPDELLTEARLPLLPAETRFGFYEFSRRAGDYALGMALVAYRIDGGKMTDVRVGVGAVEEKPRRIPEAEAALEGKAPGAEAFAAASKAAAAAVTPLEDVHTTADYRRDMARVAVIRALEAAST